jgi:3-oxoadipate enol-lactonase
MVHLQVGDVSLHCRLEGDGEPVLLVHGFPLSGEMWTPLATRLRSRYRLIIPDLRGHGASEASETASMQRYAADLAQLLDHLDETRRVVVVGLSMGGYVAFEFVRRYPERVRALVLANTRASADSPEQVRTRRDTAERVLREGSHVVADAMLGKLFSPGTAAELRDRWRGIMAATPPRGVAAALGAMAERPDSIDTLRAFASPVLVVAGRDDAVTSLDDARAMRDAAGNATLEVIEGAGHMSPVEQPDRFASVLQTFLERLPPPEPDG